MTDQAAALAERLDEIARTVQMTLAQSDDIVRAAAVLRSQGERALKLDVPHYPDGDASQHSVSSKPAALAERLAQHICWICIDESPRWWRQCAMKRHDVYIVDPDGRHEWHCETCGRGVIARPEGR